MYKHFSSSLSSIFYQALLSSTLDLHSMIVSKFAPSPSNPHYVFSQHDIQRIIQGLYLMSPRSRARPRHGGGGGGGGGGRPQGAGGECGGVWCREEEEEWGDVEIKGVEDWHHTEAVPHVTEVTCQA